MSGPIGRRRFLAGSALAGLAATAAACASATPTPSAGASARPSGTGSSATSGPASPSATAAPPSSATPSDEPTDAASPTPDPAAALRRLVLGLVVVGFRGETLGAARWARDLLREGLAGVILFDRDQETGNARNVRSPRQVRTLTAAIRAASPGGAPIVAIDQEGGRVTRLSPAHGYPAVASQATVGAGTAAAARTWAKGLAATLRAAGVTLNLAPVVDLDVNPDNPAIGALDRSFSADADVVVRMASIEVDAHRAAGVATALKHFPGIGSATGNTDDGSVDVTATWSKAELAPFRRLIEAGEADLVMVGHVIQRHLDPDRPASLSRAIVTDLLRGELGWDGPVVTDDLQAAAVAGTNGPGEAAVLALGAGCDLLLFANQQGYDEGVVEAVVDAVTAAVADGRLDRRTLDAARRRVASRFPAT